MFWRSDAREKCRFPDCDYTSLFSDGYLYWSYQTKNHHSNNKAMIEFFFSPLSLFFSLFFFFLERHERLKTKRRDERKILRFTRGRKGIKHTTKKTHTHTKKKREKKNLDMSLGFLKCVLEKTHEKKRVKKIREQKCPPPLHTAFDFERLYAVVFSKREEDNNNNNNNRHHDRDHARESDDDDDEKEDAKGRGYRRHGRGNVRRRRFGRGGRE